MKANLQVFCLLITAYSLSMIYQYYRFQVGQFPEFDTFGSKEIIGYGLFFCWSALSLSTRKWAQWAIINLCSIQLLIGFVYYIPVIFVKRHSSFWDWAECIVFILLIAWAGYLTLLQLIASRKQIATHT